MCFLLRNNLAVSYFNENALWRKRDLQLLKLKIKINSSVDFLEILENNEWK